MEVGVEVDAVGGGVRAVLQIVIRQGAKRVNRARLGINFQNVCAVCGDEALSWKPVD